MSNAERMPTRAELENAELKNVKKLEKEKLNDKEEALATLCAVLAIMVNKTKQMAEIALAVACGAVGGLIVLAVRLAMK